MSKGDWRRPEDKVLMNENWDKIKGFSKKWWEEDDEEPPKVKSTCCHSVDQESLICKHCGKTQSEILADGDGVSIQ